MTEKRIKTQEIAAPGEFLARTVTAVPFIEADVAHKAVAFKKDTDRLFAIASRHEVTGQASQEEAVNLLAAVKVRWREIDEARKALKGPFDRIAKAVDAAFRGLLDPLASAERTLKNKYAIYVVEERTRQEVALEAQRAAERKAAEALPGLVVIPREAPPAVQASVTTTSGAQAAGRLTPDFEEVDHDLIPPQYMDVSRARVIAAMRSGVQEIPGLRLVWKQDISIRAGR
jgi:hypothetical protein